MVSPTTGPASVSQAPGRCICAAAADGIRYFAGGQSFHGFDAAERVIQPLLTARKTAVIPPKSTRKIQRGYGKEAYKMRHLIENFFCKFRQYLAIATRYGKTARNFLAAIHLAAAIIRLN